MEQELSSNHNISTHSAYINEEILRGRIYRDEGGSCPKQFLLTFASKYKIRTYKNIYVEMIYFSVFWFIFIWEYNQLGWPKFRAPKNTFDKRNRSGNSICMARIDGPNGSRNKYFPMGVHSKPNRGQENNPFSNTCTVNLLVFERVR